MKALAKALLTGLIPCTMILGQTVGELDRETQLMGDIVVAEESGDEALRASLIQQFIREFPEQSLVIDQLSQQSARPAEKHLLGNNGHEIPTVPMAGVQFRVVPAAYAGIGGTATFLGPLANAQRTYQLLIHDTLLVGLAGQQITGISWRIPVSATSNWPTTDVNFTNYDIYLSGSVPPANRSLTNFSDNVVGPRTQVRSGGLTIATDSYPSGGNPNPWGVEIATTSWLYTGGHLLVEIRHTGFTGTSRSTDAISTSTSGYGTQFSACWTGNYAGTSGSQGNFTVLRLTTDSTTVSVGDGDLPVPVMYSLDQNYPNPFNPATTIKFNIPISGHVRLFVHDLLGREVATLENRDLEAGTHVSRFDATHLTSGTYFYRLESGGFVQTRKLLLLK